VGFPWDALCVFSMPDGFLLGALFAVFLLLLGLLIGVLGGRYLARRSIAAHASSQLHPVLSGLMRFTSNFSQDVSEYRSLIETASQRVEELQGSATLQSATVAEGHGSAARVDAASPIALLHQIMEANEHLRHRLNEAEATLQCQSTELNSYMTEARTDALTGLPNRRAFDDELARRLGQYRRQGTSFGVLLLDVDRFKLVNDCYGHHVGDLVLKAMGEHLRATARDCDLVARYGGEEFAMLLAGQSREEFMQAAERVRRAVEQSHVTCEGTELQVTVSCGVAEATAGEEEASLLRRADEALYASKSHGRNCCHWHDGQRPIGASVASAESIAPGSAPPLSRVMPESFREVCAELRRKLLEIAK
jgi:diguanylate cyclase